LQVDRAGQAARHQRSVRRLVHGDAVDQFGWILVVFGAAVVAGRDLLAAVQQRGGKVRRQAADRNHLRAAFNALRGQAGQAGDRFGDRHVGQLADVFGGDGFTMESASRLIAIEVSMLRRIPVTTTCTAPSSALASAACWAWAGSLAANARAAQAAAIGVILIA
jgi:hypothetical protein